jgi:hypothetical protein
MKKIIYTLMLIFFYNTLAFSQEPINVTITGVCTLWSETYNFDSILNGKNNYLAEILNPDTGEIVDFRVGFDGTQWVFYATDITDFGFFNPNIPTDVLPPNTGWIVEGCDIGTMIIDGGAIVAVTDLELQTKVTLFPNPVKDYLSVKLSNNEEVVTISIYNLLGKKIKTSQKNKINISNFQKGVYFLEVRTNNGYKISKKILKN